MRMSTQLTIADLTGDLVIYRDLQPYAVDMPGLAQLRARLGLPPDLLPRKRDSDYARVMLALLTQIQQRRGTPPLRTLLVIGDTHNDRQMAAHLRAVSGLPVFACIGADQNDTAPALTWDGNTASATRWALLSEWLEQLRLRSVVDDSRNAWNAAALLLDIDKTLLGPRGRADRPIDEARAEGALQVARELFGSAFDPTGFQSLYATLCQSEYHSLTLDNQDYVVFITLLLAADVISLAALRQGMTDGTLTTFAQVLAAVAERLPPTLTALHAEVQTAHRAGDPTPFKAFRHAEFAATVARMADGRLTFCREVVTTAQSLIAEGVLCLAASDKPSEASLPTPQQAASGLLPLHHTPAWVK